MSEQDNNQQTGGNTGQPSMWGTPPPVATQGAIDTSKDSPSHPDNDPSRAQTQPETPTEVVAQAKSGVEAAKLPQQKSGNKMEPALGREWAEQQAAAIGQSISEDVNVAKIAGRQGLQKGQVYYVGPRADADEIEQDKPSLLDILKNMLEHPFAGKKKRNTDEETREANREKLAQNAAQVQALQRPATVSPNSALPTADADGPNKVAPGQTIADSAGWQSGR